MRSELNSRAPWSDEQVEALRKRQAAESLHPYTCGNDHPGAGEGVLVPTPAGWICPEPDCVYRQDWALASDLEPQEYPTGASLLKALHEHKSSLEQDWAEFAAAEPFPDPLQATRVDKDQS